QGHRANVLACVVTPDGRRVVSASSDQTLKIWDLESGSALATLQGHDAWVNACAIIPDGRHVVSASSDQTLKVWDLESSTCLLTHRANTAFSAITATATTIVAGDAAGAVWFLDWPSSNRLENSNRIEPRTLRLPMKHTILFLAANPIET